VFIVIGPQFVDAGFNPDFEGNFISYLFLQFPIISRIELRGIAFRIYFSSGGILYSISERNFKTAMILRPGIMPKE
jgi:hypothetical protein